jgi:hypothetical protein
VEDGEEFFGRHEERRPPERAHAEAATRPLLTAFGRPIRHEGRATLPSPRQLSTSGCLVMTGGRRDPRSGRRSSSPRRWRCPPRRPHGASP